MYNKGSKKKNKTTPHCKGSIVEKVLHGIESMILT